MRRRHLRADAIQVCERARRLRPDVVFGADLIAGFPTETEAMFEHTLSLIEDCGLTWLHVFPYSSRPGTPAARMPQVPLSLRKERAARLRAAGGRAVDRFLTSRIGSTASVLVEKEGLGRSEHYAPVAVEGSQPGEIITAHISAATNGKLVGHPAA
jgi:threonylcarbamoyladenosine tRNA methylthiotransferase MtaB